MKILFTSDLHLRKREDERWDALVEICETAKKNGCERLIIAGDLFDDISTVRELGQKIGDEIFNKYDFQVHIIPGNHDFEAFTEQKYFGNNAIVHLEYSHVDINGVRIHFFPFKNENTAFSEMLLELTKNRKDKNILVLHTNLNQFNFGASEEKNYQYMESELSDYEGNNIDLVLAGHIHSKSQHWGFKGGTFYYAGSPVSITKKETGRRHVLLLDIREEIHIDELPVNTFYYDKYSYFFNLNNEEILQEMKKDMKSIGENVFLLVNVKGIINGDEKKIRGKIAKILPLDNIDLNIEINEISQLKGDSIFRDFKKRLKEENSIPDDIKIEILMEFIKNYK